MKYFASKYKKWIFYIFYFLLFLLVFILGYKWFSYAKLKASAPRYELNEELKSKAKFKKKLVAKKEKVSDKHANSDWQGALAVNFINDIFQAPIYDVAAVKINNAYLAFASDNNPEYQYANYDISNGTAVFISERKGRDLFSDTPHIFMGKVRGVKLPNRFYDIRDLGTMTHVPKELLSLSPDKSRLLFSSKTKKDKIYLFDFRAKDVMGLADGSFARWVDNDSFVYLSGQSLKIFNTKNRKTYELWKAEAGDINWLDVSKKKAVLAISLPGFNRVSIVRLNKQGGVYSLEQIGVLKIQAKSLALSPNAKYVAVMFGEPGAWELRIYNLSTFEEEKSLLSESRIFEFHYSDFAELSDWY